MRPQQWGQSCAAALAGVRCSGLRSGLRLQHLVQKGAGEGAGAHRGLGLVGETAQGVDGDGRRRRWGGARGGAGCRAPPSS
jgi:hypothetical protein